MNPIETVKGKITDIDESGRLVIEAQYDNWHLLTKRQYKDVEITLTDSRPLSDKQRRMVYALLGEIADYTGDDLDDVKTQRKLDFTINELQENGERLLSFASSPMSVVAAFQGYLVKFVIKHDIPTKFALRDYAPDIGEYVYYCLIYRKCACCGKPADLHHVERVGMGRNREEIVHEGMECLPLCRAHHAEAHTMTDAAFMDKHHFDGGIKIDRTISKIYGLKIQKPQNARKRACVRQ